MTEFLKKYRWPLVVAVVAIAVRVIYLWQISRDPGFQVPMVDEKWHWLWAQDILHKSFWGEGSYFRAPLYPYFLAALALITNSSILWSKILQVLLCGGTAVFLYRLSEHLFNRKTAIVAGFIYAFYGTLVFYEAMFLIPAIFLFLVVWGIYRLLVHQDRQEWYVPLITGIVLGLAALARPNILLTVPFLMLWMYFSSNLTTGLLSRSRRPLILLLGVVLTVLPVTIRNKIVTGDYILISSQGGINLYLGNNPDADGLTMLMPEVQLNEAVSWDQFGEVTRAAAEREAMHPLSDAQESSFWSTKAVKFIVHNPGKFLDLIWRKTVYLLDGFENSDNADIYYQRNRSSLFSVLVWHKLIYFPYGLLLPLTIAGIYLTRERFKSILPIYIYLVAYIPSIVLFLVTARHRLPLVPFMIMLSAAGVVKLFSGSVRTKSVAMATLLFAIPLVFLNMTYYDEGESSGFQVHFNNGIKYEQLGDLVRAEQEYQLADDIFPSSPTLLNNLGYTQFRNGKYELAADNYLRAIALKPGYSAPYNNLGLLMLKKNAPDSAISLFRRAISAYKEDAARPNELSQIHANLADAFDKKGIPDSAVAEYNEAFATGPQNFDAIVSGANFYIKQENFPLADSLFARARHLHDLDGTDYFNWGLTYFKRKNYDAMIMMMFRATKRDETLSQAYYGLALGYYMNGYPKDSLNKYLDICLKGDPTYQPAIDMKKLLAEKKD